MRVGPDMVTPKCTLYEDNLSLSACQQSNTNNGWTCVAKACILYAYDVE